MGVLIGTGLAVAVFATLVGAWPILPFAGLEAVLIWFAFRCLSLHDDDFERVEVSDGRVRLESRCANRTRALDAHATWARLLVEERRGRCRLALRYAGQTVAIGELVAEPTRRRWAEELGQRIPVIHV